MAWGGVTVAAIAMLACVLDMSTTPPRPLQEEANATDDAIVVIGTRLRTTKVDYRLRGTRISYCGPRDKKQNMPRVRLICALAKRCVEAGAVTRRTIPRCVNERLDILLGEPGKASTD